MTDAKILQSVPLFTKLHAEELAQVGRIAREQKYATGDVICAEGSPGKEFYVLAAGTADIAKNVAGGRRKVLANLAPGAVFGELTLFDSGPRSASAIAGQGCMLYVFEKEVFLKVLEMNKDIGVKVLMGAMELVCKRLRASNEQAIDGVVWGFQMK